MSTEIAYWVAPEEMIQRDEGRTAQSEARNDADRKKMKEQWHQMDEKRKERWHQVLKDLHWEQ
jgi:hypothetical protein